MSTDYFKRYNLDETINPVEFMGIRGKRYKNIFFNHNVYKNIKNSILNNQLTLIIGNPISGKTRIVFDSIKELTGYTLLKPLKSIDTEEYILDSDNSKSVFFFDDVDEYFNTNNNNSINKLFKEIIIQDIKCVITCRTGPEFKVFKNSIEKHVLPEFSENLYRIPSFSKNYAPLGIFLEKYKSYFRNDVKEYDGNLGSLFLPLSDMRRRFEQLQIDDKEISLSILLGLKIHYHFFNYEENKSSYDEIKIKYFSEKYLGYRISEYDWDNAKRNLLDTQTDLNFIIEDDYIRIEEVYLDFLKDNNDLPNDVIFSEFNKKRLKKIINEKYDADEKKLNGFPLSTSDFNEKIKKATSYDEGFSIFKEIKNTNAFSFINLMNLTSDNNKIIEIYEEMRKLKRIDEFFIPQNIIIGKFKTFETLLLMLIRVKSKQLIGRNGVTDRLIKLSQINPKESLMILFNNFSLNEIYSNTAFN